MVCKQGTAVLRQGAWGAHRCSGVLPHPEIRHFMPRELLDGQLQADGCTYLLKTKGPGQLQHGHAKSRCWVVLWQHHPPEPHLTGLLTNA